MSPRSARVKKVYWLRGLLMQIDNSGRLIMVLHHVARADRHVSHLLFNLQLPYPVEVLLSIPGTWFGMPITALLLVPLLLSVLECHATLAPDVCGGDKGAFGTNLVLVVAVAYVSRRFVLVARKLWYAVAWVVACAESVRRRSHEHSLEEHYGTSRFMFPLGMSRARKALGALVLPFYGGAAIFSYLLRVSTKQQLVYQYYVAWFATQMAVQMVKTAAARARPTHGSPHLAQRPRHLEQIRHLIRQEGTRFESFPSGDAAGAGVALFFFLHAVRDSVDHGPGSDSWLRAVVVTLAVLSCAGRMFYHCHHLVDVVVGLATGYFVSSFFASSLAHLATPPVAIFAHFSMSALVAWTHLSKKKKAAVVAKKKHELDELAAAAAAS